ncbi:MAG: PEP-CTERM sorting domain-containing protein [Verrucomicrobia bacterium]|nr:PEP-CTERM sorting domain-containing protein [Verrucomicrobiota bacterium]
MRVFLVLSCVLLCAGSAWAGNIVLDNWDIETNSSGQFGAIDNWGPNGGWAPHAGFFKPNNETLGLYFGFYSAGTTETVGQLTGEVITANTLYEFWSWAMGGGDDVGTLPYQIGYAATDGDLASFVQLATATYELGGTWGQTAGVSYMTGLSGDEIGKQLIVRLGDGSVGGSSDIWFDNFEASKTLVPEPGTIGLLGVGVLGLLAARRKK